MSATSFEPASVMEFGFKPNYAVQVADLVCDLIADLLARASSLLAS